MINQEGTCTKRKVFFKTRKYYKFYSGKLFTEGELTEEGYNTLLAHQKTEPVIVMKNDSIKKKWWYFQNEFYWEDDGLTKEEVKALILDRILQRKKKIERAISRVNNIENEQNTRKPIPDDVKMIVWQRDGGKCVICGSNELLEYDHIIPVSKGGSNTARNIQILCEKCNRAKGGNIV